MDDWIIAGIIWFVNMIGFWSCMYMYKKQHGFREECKKCKKQETHGIQIEKLQ